MLVEIDWLKTLLPLFDFSRATPPNVLDIVAQAAGPRRRAAVKRHEHSTRHDVKAVEYWLRERLQAHDLGHLQALVHFGCTSADINNLALGRMITGATTTVLQPALTRLLTVLCGRAEALGAQRRRAQTFKQSPPPRSWG